MKLPLLQFWQAVRSSYWFVPSLMALGAIVLGAFMVWLDAGPAAGLLEPLGWYQQSKPEGARAVLSAIAGSMITVAGVVFSITMVAISFAANQYGPRILTNFMSDRGNQITLGTFISTFVYSVVVLRTIYSGESTFVPQLAVMVALALALCSIAVLIYFIHHVPDSIHINTITSRVGRQLISSIDKQFPACLGDPPEYSDAQVEQFEQAAEAAFGSGGDAEAIPCESNGYVQAIDDDHLLSIACEHDLVISVRLSPGHFVFEGRTIVLAAPRGHVTDEVKSSIQGSWAVGSRRTPGQDVLFLIDELVEIAARALSTGVNDPYTAITCADWLTAAAVEVARRQPPSRFRLDSDQALRVIAPRGTFELHIERGFGRLRSYAAKDVNAASHFLSSIAVIAGQCRSSGHAEVLSRQAESLFDLARQHHGGPSLERLETEMAAARAAILELRSRSGERIRDAIDTAEGERARRRIRHRAE